MKKKDQENSLHDKEKTVEEGIESNELNLDELLEVQGGSEDEEKDKEPDCGLGCFIGNGY